MRPAVLGFDETPITATERGRMKSSTASAPLIVMLTQGNRSPYLRSEAVKALNFQVLWSIIALVGWATSCIGIGIVIGAIAWLVAIIFGVIAGVKASNNEPYNYPMTVQIIK